MMRFLFTLLFCLHVLVGLAQQPGVDQLRATALSFQRQQDYSNTIMVLAKALELEPNNLNLLKDIAFTFYLGGDLKKASAYILPLTERVDADVQVYQIAGLIFKATEEYKLAEKLYKKGLKKFSSSGPLFSEYGELLWTLEKPAEAIAQWESGINLDPSYSMNYYHAAKFYFAAADMARSLVYGEVFVNLESYSVRTAEMKVQLLESYKRVFAAAEPKKHYIKPTTAFETLFLSVLRKQSNVTVRGITTETLVAIRTRFVLDWFNAAAGKFPFQLFDHMQFLLKEGMFESYNQWLFGPVTDVAAFQQWTKTHAEAYASFTLYQRNKLFRMPARQHYF
jgi:tetratricopeptide (TPR) repeat protein